MKTVIIVEKPSQARDLRAAIGSRFGEILPAEGHLIRLAEPDEVNAEWKRWSCDLLKPEGLYPPTRRKRCQVSAHALERPGIDASGSHTPEQSASAENSLGAKQGNARKPTTRMLAFARSLAKKKFMPLPHGCEQSFDQCRAFLEQHAGSSGTRTRKSKP